MQPLNFFAASDIADKAIDSLRSETGKAFAQGHGGEGCLCPYCQVMALLLTLDENEANCEICGCTFHRTADCPIPDSCDHDSVDIAWQDDGYPCHNPKWPGLGQAGPCDCPHFQKDCPYGCGFPADPQDKVVDNLFRALFHDSETCPVCQGALYRDQF